MKISGRTIVIETAESDLVYISNLLFLSNLVTQKKPEQNASEENTQ